MKSGRDSGAALELKLNDVIVWLNAILDLKQHYQAVTEIVTQHHC